MATIRLEVEETLARPFSRESDEEGN
jgi:hypothetical protein